MKRFIDKIIDSAFFDGELKRTFPYSQGDRETSEKIWTKEVEKRSTKNREKHISLSKEMARELNRRLIRLQSISIKL